MPGAITTGSVLVIAAALVGCGPRAPAHDGYRSAGFKPWQKPQVLELDDLGEVEVDDTVSYPKQRRARWFAVDLPAFGELEVRLTYAPLILGGTGELDLAFEVLNENYTVLMRADAGEDDAGDDKKSRTLYELDAGRYYVHVYTQARLDEAEFNLRLAFQRAAREHDSNFPAEVAFVRTLPAVPPVDDAPAPVARPCRGAGCKKPRPPRERPNTDSTAQAMRGRIAGITATASGTQIRIDRGSSAGVEVGWRGNVITSAGSAIPDGGFRVTRVTASESYGAVKATADAVTSARFVRLRPP